MATATARPRLHPRSDNLFFSGMAVIALITILIGFARSYFLAGLFRAPLPNLLVHVRAVAFTLWIILFITQVSLVTACRVDLHRRLGLFGFVLAIVMVVLGTLTASDSLARHVARPGTDTVEGVRAFYAVPLRAMLLFSTFAYLGYRNRFQPPVHKRLMWFATLSLLDAGFDRWPVFDPYSLPVVNLLTYAAPAVDRLRLVVHRQGTARHDLVFDFPDRCAATQSSPWPHRYLAKLRGLGCPAHALVFLKTLSPHMVDAQPVRSAPKLSTPNLCFWLLTAGC